MLPWYMLIVAQTIIWISHRRLIAKIVEATKSQDGALSISQW